MLEPALVAGDGRALLALGAERVEVLAVRPYSSAIISAPMPWGGRPVSA